MNACSRANRRIYAALSDLSGHPPAPPRRSAQAPRQRQDDLAGWLRQSPSKPNSYILEHIRRLKAWQALDLLRHRAVGAPEPPAQIATEAAR